MIEKEKKSKLRQFNLNINQHDIFQLLKILLEYFNPIDQITNVKLHSKYFATQ